LLPRWSLVFSFILSKSMGTLVHKQPLSAQHSSGESRITLSRRDTSVHGCHQQHQRSLWICPSSPTPVTKISHSISSFSDFSYFLELLCIYCLVFTGTENASRRSYSGKRTFSYRERSRQKWFWTTRRNSRRSIWSQSLSLLDAIACSVLHTNITNLFAVLCFLCSRRNLCLPSLNSSIHFFLKLQVAGNVDLLSLFKMKQSRYFNWTKID